MLSLPLGIATHWASVVKHKGWVARFLLAYWVNPLSEVHSPALLWRAVVHDLSKFRWRETKGFATTVRELSSVTYGSPEYKALVKRIAPSVQAHYKVNSHHPEFHPDGVAGMSDLDFVEMVADWCAARRRHADGDFEHSLEVNRKRWNLDEATLTRIRKARARMGNP